MSARRWHGKSTVKYDFVYKNVWGSSCSGIGAAMLMEMEMEMKMCGLLAIGLRICCKWNYVNVTAAAAVCVRVCVWVCVSLVDPQIQWVCGFGGCRLPKHGLMLITCIKHAKSELYMAVCVCAELTLQLNIRAAIE